MAASPSGEKSIQETSDYKPSGLLTIHELLHIREVSVDNSGRMSCSRPGLVLRQSVKPRKYCLDALLLEKFLYKFDCMVLSKVKRRRGRTHLIAAA